MTITSTIVLPKLKCTSTKAAIYPSTGGYFAPATGAFSSAGMFVGCVHGRARYYPAFTVFGAARNFAKLHAKAGDTVVLKTSIQSGKTVLPAVDKTTKAASKKVSAAGVGSGGAGLPWAGDLGWPATSTSPIAVPDFGKLTFSHSKLDGLPFGGSSPQGYDRYNGSTLQILTKPFAADEETFTTVFKHS